MRLARDSGSTPDRSTKGDVVGLGFPLGLFAVVAGTDLVSGNRRSKP